MGLAVDGRLALFHGLEQGGLRLGAGAVDLVGEENLGKHRTWPEVEVVFLLVEGAHAGHIGREKIGCELDATESAVERAGQGFCEHRLADTRHVLDEKVPLAEEGDEAEPDFLFLVDDRAADVRHKGIGNSGDDFRYHAPPTMPGIIDLTFLQPFEVNTRSRAIWFRISLRLGLARRGW